MGDVPLGEAPRGAVLQRDKETYMIIPRLKGGMLTAEILKKFADVAEKYQLPMIKITGAQRIALFGVKREDVEAIWSDLDLEPAPTGKKILKSVKICPGLLYCKNAQQDAMGLGLKLEEKFLGMTLPGKIKIGVSGCPNNCAEGWIKDFGVFGRAKGYTVVVGGKLGNRPSLGRVLYEGLTEEDVLSMAEKILTLFKENANPGERVGKVLERLGHYDLMPPAGADPALQ
ncbi:MAG: NAD(P)/FAD-dependent oxidoreductase [Thermacetogeniaceae bacterium]